MSFRLKSLVKKAPKTVRETISNSATTEVYQINSYMDANFYEGENYKSIINCLNEGINIYNDLIDYMQDYHDLLQDYSASLTSYSKRSKSKLKEQSALSSYNTTKRAQRQTIGIADDLAAVIDARCTVILNLIHELRKEVDQYYPNRGVGRALKHNRADSLKDEFKTARSSLKSTEEKLEQLKNKKTKAKEAVDDAAIAHENILHGPSNNESKLERAKKKLDEKQRELESIEKQISQTEIELGEQMKTYRERANVIFEKCQAIERKRLELIRATLIKFIQTIHSDDQTVKIDGIYTDVLSKIRTDQSTTADLKFWADTYGVHFSTSATTTSETPAITISDAEGSATQTEVAVGGATTVSESPLPKAKGKRNKSSAEPTTPTIQE